MKLHVKGVCATATFARSGYSGQAVVVFTEMWPWRLFHYAENLRRPQAHSWLFVVLPDARVKLLAQSGEFPPQWVM